MRCLHRNKTKFYYAPYIGNELIVDECGNYTGEHELKYGEPVECFANISAAKGETYTRQFGEAENYDKVIVLESLLDGLNEYSRLWVDNLPKVDENGKLDPTSTPHDYIIKKVAQSINSVSIAISKVTVRE